MGFASARARTRSRSLELVTSRRWLLTIALDDCADCGVKLGKRVFETTDAGAHWTAR